MRVDVHQHIWTAPLLERLAARQTMPLARRSNGMTMLYSAGERPYAIDLAAEASEWRARLVRRDGLDMALVAISSPIGIEALPRESSLELIEAYLEGVDALPGEFAAWGPVALDRSEPADIDGLLARGCVGVSLPAGALAGPDRLEQLGPVLERACARGLPVFVHPGPAPGQVPADASLGEPLWWRPLTDYISQMQAAWLSFASYGRRDHPELAVIFAVFAGGAPLLVERLEARGGPAIDLRDPGIYYETSSFGPAAVEMMAHRVGEAQLLYGSDRPVIEPKPTGRDALLQRNAAALFGGVEAVAA
jgi:predicted TIM-barrel fold metal-dependent hydrolase